MAQNLKLIFLSFLKLIALSLLQASSFCQKSGVSCGLYLRITAAGLQHESPKHPCMLHVLYSGEVLITVIGRDEQKNQKL